MNNPLKYSDPSGEFIFTAIIIGAAVAGAYFGGTSANGGEYNPTKWDWNSGSTWAGIGGGAAIGAASAATGGAVAGWASAAGASGLLSSIAGGAASGLIQGGLSTLLPGGSGKFLQGAAIGTVSGIFGGAAAYGVTQGVSNIMVNGFNVTNPVLKGVIGGAFGGAGGGYTGGFAVGYITTGSFEKANQMALNSAVFGAANGAVVGAVTQYKLAKANGIDPWSGRLEPTSGNTIVRHHTNSENMRLIRKQQQIFASRKGDYDFYGADFEASANFKGIQNFDSMNKGAFIEMSIPSSSLIQNPLPIYNNYYRYNTGSSNFNILNRYNPQYFRVFNF